MKNFNFRKPIFNVFRCQLYTDEFAGDLSNITEFFPLSTVIAKSYMISTCIQIWMLRKEIVNVR